LFVNELCQVACADLREVGNSEDEADRVKDIRLSRTIETGDGIKVWIESGVFRVTSSGGGEDETQRTTIDANAIFRIKNSPSNNSTMSVGLETVDDDFFYMHDDGGCLQDRVDGDGLPRVEHKGLSLSSSARMRMICCLSPLSAGLSLDD
jgi:hypothetical protein